MRARGTRLARWTGRAACLALLALGTGCVSETREAEIGREMAQTVNTHIPLVRDPILNAYVSSLGRLLATSSSRPKLEYRFFIINSDQVNAFALPGGFIYVTRGLIERTENGGELAAVLAHEIGHVASRHGVQKLQRHLRTGSLVNLLYTLFLGGEPEILRQNATQLAGMLWSASHSREDEAQADRLAVEYLIRTGFDPQAMLSLLETLVEDEAGHQGEISGWFSSHPMTTERITATREVISSGLKATPRGERLFLASYPSFLERLEALPPAPDAP